jgi:hypothetical protein
VKPITPILLTVEHAFGQAAEEAGRARVPRGDSNAEFGDTIVSEPQDIVFVAGQSRAEEGAEALLFPSPARSVR